MNRRLGLVIAIALMSGGCSTVWASRARPTAIEARISAPAAPAANQVPPEVRRLRAKIIIPATDPQARLKAMVPGVRSGRVDPFAPIPGQPIPRQQPVQAVEATQVAAGTISSLPPIPPPPPLLPAAPSSPAPLGAPRVGAVAIPRTAVPVPPPIQSPLQPPVQAPSRLSSGILVTGIMQLASNELSALIKAPQEAMTQVKLGDRLYGGKVTVKGFDLSGPVPIVTFEEAGVVVRRGVGQQAEGAAPATVADR
ncbi:hypothetical protein [Leptolyngbya sp. FACHB-261]|uniref:hypothetical protein n=1 Tax=Leptolyngbya sp. FACHB-261 TaxID=2692806 RepID=UPI0016861776|nr:hypothetical protein [Leptolyngbya sp. FACHB-261]MBD2102639.1 hypothetical protein [Leptolyngbya sp. FACHB-261]